MTLAKRQRQSNLELLRIISMMLVMLGHYLPLRSSTTINSLSLNPLKALMNLELHSITIVCVHCFILISGYFGIRWKAKSFLGLIFQLLFWAVIGYFIAQYFIEPFVITGHSYTLTAFIKSMFNWYQGRWFVSAYLFLYIFSPLINAFIDHTSERKILNYIIIFYIFSSVYGWVIQSKEFNTGLSAVSLMGLYLVGAWLRKSTLSIVHWNKWYDLTGFIVCTLLLTGISALLLKIGIRSSIYGYLNPITIFEAAFLFQFFRKLNVGTVSWVNFLAASAFAAFLLHCHPFASFAYNYICKALHQYDYALIYVLVFIAAVFVLSVIIDKVRIILWNAIDMMYVFVTQKITPQIQNTQIKLVKESDSSAFPYEIRMAFIAVR